MSSALGPVASGVRLGAGTAWTLLAALGFAAVSTLTTVATEQQVALFTVLSWRYLLGAIVMLAYVGSQSFPPMSRRETVNWIVFGGGGQALLVGLALSSVRWISVATLAFLFYTYPAWVTLVQAIRGAERLTVRRVVALALSFAGVVLMVGTPGGRALPWQGVALALGAAVVYGVYIPVMQVMQKDHPVSLTSAYAKIGSAACFLVLAVGSGSFTWAMTTTAWWAILALTVFSTVLPSIFFLMGLMRLGPVRTAIVSTVEPFLTAVLGAVVLHQPLAGSTLGGGVLIVAAVVLLSVRPDRET